MPCSTSLHDPATLVVAFGRVAGNHGANTPGVDGLTVDCVEEAVGVPGFLDDLRAALKDGSFRPLPVRERKIPTPGGSGKLRKLGIPARFMIVEGLPRYAPKRLRGQAQPTKPGHLMGSRSSYGRTSTVADYHPGRQIKMLSLVMPAL
jgi:hypothetical protein